MADFYYDDTRLRKLFEALSPKERQKALKGAFRKAANDLRKLAVQNLRTSGLRSNRDVEKGIRAVVWKRNLGFRVTIGTKRKSRSKTENRAKALRSIVPLWAEGGTEDRYSTRTRYSKLGNLRWRRHDPKGKYRGRLDAYGFMEKTKNEATGVEENLKQAIIDKIEQAVRKAGATIS